MVKLSKTHTKFIKSLQLKKYRQLEQTFLVEGEKSVLEVLRSGFVVKELITTENFAGKYKSSFGDIPTYIVSDLSSLGSLKSNDAAIAVVEMPQNKQFDLSSGLTLVADDINDPGNFGTILRIADWFGLNGIIASENTCELYNPKVISASKGSFTRVKVFYTEPGPLLQSSELPVYAADMTGEDVHLFDFPKDAFLILGNESHGISASLEKYLTGRINIPQYGAAESLNVGVATAIIADNYRRINS